MGIKHATAATGTDSGDGKISKNAWNEDHSGGVEAPTTYVRQYIASGQSVNTSSHNLTLPSTPSTNVIVLAWAVESASITINSITQTGASWSKLYGYVNGNSIEVWKTPSGASSASITVTMSGSGWSHCAALEVVGITGSLAGSSSQGTPFVPPMTPASSANFQIITARAAGGAGSWDIVAQPFPAAITVVQGTNGGLWFADGPMTGRFSFTEPSGTNRIVSIGSID